MGLRPAKFREKPAEANKYRTWGGEAAGFFDPVAASRCRQLPAQETHPQELCSYERSFGLAGIGVSG
jgi:hypothetical protein